VGFFYGWEILALDCCWIEPAQGTGSDRKDAKAVTVKRGSFFSGRASHSAGLSTSAAAGPSSRRSRGTFGFDGVPTNRSGIGPPWPAVTPQRCG